MTEHHDAAPDRREFLKAAGATGAAAALAPDLLGAPVPPPQQPPLPRRAFGRTKEQVSILGLGGHALGLAPSFDEAVRIVHEAIDAGVNFFDNAWEYHEGRAEDWMGRALEPGGRRKQVFLMTKVCTHGRDAKVAMRQLDESLQRLRTDHLDLWQIHECVYENDPELHFARGGVVEALDQARRQGKVRFVGFTGHKDPRIHLKMLSYKYPFDAVQMPLNCFDASYHSFEKQVLPVVNRRGLAALGMKSLSGGGYPVLSGLVTAEEALRYAMSLPVTTTISGIDSLEVLRQNVAVARGFQAMTPREMEALRQRVAPVAADGRMERYKSTMQFDGDVGRGQHGFPPKKDMPL